MDHGRIEGKIDIIGQMVYDKLVENQNQKEIVKDDKSKGFKPKVDQ